MANKIYTNHTYEEYTKKYRIRNYRLLSYTKKEVEDFDAKHHSSVKGYLLKNRIWWLIEDTYYEIPKAPRYTWFRNLNGAIQATCCLLAAGVVTTAIVVPTVIAMNNKTVEPTIVGASYDKAVSHIELHKESTIILKTTDKEITGIESIKVGGRTLTHDEYSFSLLQKKIIIKAEAMTSTDIEIKVKTDEHKQQSITLDKTSMTIVASADPVTIKATLSDKGTGTIVATPSSDNLLIKATGEPGEFYVAGYIEGNESITFTCEGYTPAICTVKVTETDRRKFIRLYKEYNKVYCNSSAIYEKSDIPSGNIGVNGESPIGGTIIDSVKTDGEGTKRHTEVRFFAEIHKLDETRDISTNNSEGYKALDLLKEASDNVEYTFSQDGTISYFDDEPGEGEIYCMTVNKFGYIEELWVAHEGKNPSGYNVTITKDPHIVKAVTLNYTELDITLGGNIPALIATLPGFEGTSKDIKCDVKGDDVIAIKGILEQEKGKFDISLNTTGETGEAEIIVSCEGYTSATCKVKVSESKETNKDKFIALFNEYNKEYNSSQVIYTLSDFGMIHVSDGGEGYGTSLDDVKTEYINSTRTTTIYFKQGNTLTIDTNNCGLDLSKLVDDDSLYDFTDDTISYENQNAEDGELCDLVVNKFGYIVSCYVADESRGKPDANGYYLTIKNDPTTKVGDFQLEYDSYYIYTDYNSEKKALEAGTKYNLTASPVEILNIDCIKATYGDGTNYVNMGYNDETSLVNVTKMLRKDNEGNVTELSLENNDFEVKEGEAYGYTYNYISFTNKFTKGESLIIECNLPKGLELGLSLWGFQTE